MTMNVTISVVEVLLLNGKTLTAKIQRVSAKMIIAAFANYFEYVEMIKTNSMGLSVIKIARLATSSSSLY